MKMPNNEALISDPSSPKSKAYRLKYLRKSILSLSRDDFCEGSEIPAPSLKAWELAGGGGLSEKGAKKVVEQLQKFNVTCTVGWLLHGVGLDPSISTGSATRGEDTQIIKELLAFRDQPGTLDALIKDDSMFPLLLPGDYVGGIIKPELKDCVDLPCIIVTAQNLIFVRILGEEIKSGIHNLLSLNKDSVTSDAIIPNVKILKAAPICWIRKTKPNKCY